MCRFLCLKQSSPSSPSTDLLFMCQDKPESSAGPPLIYLFNWMFPTYDLMVSCAHSKDSIYYSICSMMIACLRTPPNSTVPKNRNYSPRDSQL